MSPAAQIAVVLTAFGFASEDIDTKPIQGTWKVEAAELAGKEFPAEVRKSITLVLDGDTYTADVGGSVDKGTVKRDPTRSPKAMTVTGTDGPNKGKAILAIYELKGDTLKVCYDLSGKAFPEAFATRPGTLLYLVTYRRATP